MSKTGINVDDQGPCIYYVHTGHDICNVFVCLQILLFRKNRSVILLWGWSGRGIKKLVIFCGRHKCVTLHFVCESNFFSNQIQLLIYFQTIAWFFFILESIQSFLLGKPRIHNALILNHLKESIVVFAPHNYSYGSPQSHIY